MTQPIDFVIPWVDAADPRWQVKKQSLIGEDTDIVNSSNGSERFRDYGTLRYLVRSIEKYASWVNHVYIVTDAQVPDWLDQSKLKGSRYSIVDHQEIMTEDQLPCFNSNAIELSAVNIPELSEQFVMFNDDLLINSMTRPDDFFQDGRPKDFRLYTSLKPYSDYDCILFNNSRAINHWLQGNWKSKYGLRAREYGKQNIKNFYHEFFESRHSVSGYSFPHNAQAFLKSSFVQAEKIWPDEIRQTKTNHFRTNQDISMLLVRDYQLELGLFKVRRPSFSQYHNLNDINGIELELAKHQHPLTCLNDADTHNYEAVTKKVQVLLEKAFPDPASIER